MNVVKVQTKQDIFDSLSENKGAIKSFGVKSLGLFGSFVKNTQTDISDVDILVEFEPEKKTFDNLEFANKLFNAKNIAQLYEAVA